MKMTTRRVRINRTEQMVAETSDWVPTLSPTADLAAAIADAPLFAGCDRRDVASILAEFDEARFPSGRRIVLEGLRGSDFFLVVAGSAAVLVDGWRVATLGPGDFFGEIAVLGGQGLRSASVRAETPLQCLVLPNGKLEQLILDHPQLGINLIRTVIGRFQDVAGRRQPPASELVSA
jgi:CRP-like cAMP-binding protein